MTHATHAELVAEAQKLMHKRDALESELTKLQSLLKTHNMGMTEPLVDTQGFPLTGVDVYTVRNTRTSIIRLLNDHKALTNELELILQRVHEVARSEGITTTSRNSASPNSNAPHSKSLAPFAKVNAVAPDSPAWNAGLRRDDLVTKFGSVHAESEIPLKLLFDIVQKSENRLLNVHIKREGYDKIIELIPQKWSGRGLLGCHITAIE
ncbi:putative 26S proteasome regulatory subunit [Batrachochytrium dendrobatidis]